MIEPEKLYRVTVKRPYNSELETFYCVRRTKQSVQTDFEQRLKDGRAIVSIAYLGTDGSFGRTYFSKVKGDNK